MKLLKYHALGNDYIVLDPKDLSNPLKSELVGLICRRNCGIGSDGMLLGNSESTPSDSGLRIFHPDGERSGKRRKRTENFRPGALGPRKGLRTTLHGRNSSRDGFMRSRSRRNERDG